MIVETTSAPEMNYIIECMYNIDKKYYVEEITRFDGGALVLTGEFRANESTYVTQLVNKIEQKFRKESIHIDKFYQTDQPKHLMLKSANYTNKYERSFKALFSYNGAEDEEFYKVPDIVIHSGPQDINEHNQIFLSEVKTTLNLTQRLFDIDLFKLNVYHEELSFQNSAFIIVNSTVESVKRKLNEYKNNRYYQTQKKGIYIIVKPSFDSSIEVFTLL